jgi:hypothetical protein
LAKLFNCSSSSAFFFSKSFFLCSMNSGVI